MSNMFYNYDHNIDRELNCELEPPKIPSLPQSTTTALLYNIKGDALGIEVKHQMPFTIYFHLEEAFGRSLDKLLANHLVEFKLFTREDKEILNKQFNGLDIFNTNTNDLTISVTQEDASLLKQESYKINLSLVGESDFYNLFSRSDGLLVVR